MTLVKRNTNKRETIYNKSSLTSEEGRAVPNFLNAYKACCSVQNYQEKQPRLRFVQSVHEFMLGITRHYLDFSQINPKSCFV